MAISVRAVKTRRFEQDEDLFEFLCEALPPLKENDCLCVTSKIIALAQGRSVSLENVSKEEWIRRESAEMLKTPWCWLTLKNGEWCANAGVDESNAHGRLILLPKNIGRLARDLRNALRKKYHLRRLGIIITDTRIYPMRVGTMGVSLAHAGFRGVKSYIGSEDLFGRKLAHTQSSMANALAVMGVFAMGEGAEQTPLAVIRGASLEFTDVPENPKRFVIPPQDDLYRVAYYHTGKRSSHRPSRS